MPADAPGIAAVHVAAWQAGYVGLMPQDFLDKLDVEQRTAAWQKTLSTLTPGTGVLVACDAAGIVAGFCMLGPSRDAGVNPQRVAELFAINLHPQAWNRGIGTALCRACLQLAASGPWAEMTLWVLHGNWRARSFYQRLGFTRDGADKHDLVIGGQALHEVRYRIPIARSGF